MALSHETGSNDEGADGDRSVQEEKEAESQETNSRNSKNVGAPQETNSRNAKNADESQETNCRTAKNVGDVVVVKDSKVCDGDEDSCLLYTSPSPRDATLSRMPSSA